jgi:hypothetical protein
MLAGQRVKPRALTDEVVEAVVFSEPAEKPKTMAVDLLLPSEGRQVRCYLWKDERSRQVTLGQSLLVRGADRGFVRSSDWQEGGQGLAKLTRVDCVRLWFLGLRHQLLNRYKALQADDDQYAILNIEDIAKARNAVLLIRKADSGEIIFGINLPYILASGRNYQERYYHYQEYLDREYDYRLQFIIRGGRVDEIELYLGTHVHLIPWAIRQQHENLE